MSKESGHWYFPVTGEPAHFQPCKTREGTRPTTLADAKRLGLLPSVSSILRVLDKPALRDWLIRQAVHAVVTAPDIPGEGIDAKLVRVLESERQQDQESDRARDLGADVHAAIESALAGQFYEPEFAPFVKAALDEVAKLGTVKASEKILVHPLGFAGKTDLIMQSNVTTVLDFKTCKNLPTKGAWKEHVLQVSAYTDAVNVSHAAPLVLNSAVLYISTTEPGKVMLYTDEDWQDAFEVFKSVFQVWKWMNGYNPLHWNPKEQ